MTMNEHHFIARVPSGLEELVATILSSQHEGTATIMSHRSILFTSSLPIEAALSIPYIDDLFLLCGTFSALDHTRKSLSTITTQSTTMEIAPALLVREKLCPSPKSYSITASFLGKRNYSRWDIARAVQKGLPRNWPYRYIDPQDEQVEIPDVHLRIHLFDDTGFCSIRLADVPLYKRAYKQIHRKGSLSPTIAAAMLACIPHQPVLVLDPMAGCGTILAEASSLFPNAYTLGCDSDYEAVVAMRCNTQHLDRTISMYGDARALPFPNQSVDSIVCDLPWGVQTQLLDSTSDTVNYDDLIAEWQRVLHNDGIAILLTEQCEALDDAVRISTMNISNKVPLSLYGRHPVIHCLVHQ